MLDDMRRHARTQPTTTIAPILRDIAVPLGEGILAYWAGDYSRAVDLMLPLRYRWRPLGGSWAQRDVFQRLLIEAALRAGRVGLARALLAERIALKPASAPARRDYARAVDAAGERSAAAAASAEADRILAAAH